MMTHTTQTSENTQRYAAQLREKYGTLLLSRDQIAQELQRSPDALRQAERTELATLGTLRLKIGRSVRYSADAFAEWVLSQ